MNFTKARVRLTSKAEYADWDSLMNKHHYLGFRGFFSLHLRYSIDIDDQLTGLAGWQYGALYCAARDDYIGWDKPTLHKNIRYIINNTRFLIIGAKGQYPNLGSWAFRQILARISADWHRIHGHPLLLAESFVDRRYYSGHMYKASGWYLAGQTKGYSRQTERWQPKHGHIKDIYLRKLRKNACKLLRKPIDRARFA